MKADRKTGATPPCAAAVSLRPAKAETDPVRESAGISRTISAIPDALRGTGTQSVFRTRARSLPIWIGSAMTILPAARRIFYITEKHERSTRAGGRVVGSFEHTDQMLLVDESGASSVCGKATAAAASIRQTSLIRVHLVFWHCFQTFRKNRWRWVQNSSARMDVCTISLPQTCPAVDDGYDRVDMNPQFVLLVCRDYLWTGDREYLARMWPHIEKAMDNTQLLDGDGDGLPDHDTRANTYDAWAMQGTPAYIASLWLAALKAAVRMAQDLGAQDRAARVGSVAGKGQHRLLWKSSGTADISVSGRTVTSGTTAA